MWWKSAVFLLLLCSRVNSQEISCNYIQRGAYPYTCQLTIQNPQGSDAFTTIPGEHLPNKTNADVELVDSFSQDTLNIPAVICQQFPNLVDLYMAVNNIQIIQESSFAACRNLRSATLVYNAINSVPANTFRNNPNLEFIYLSWNNVSQLTSQSFTGSAALFIDLEFNNLGAMPGGLFRGSWFEGVNSTLQSLSVMGNNIRGIEVNGFANLRNLAWLDLTANPLFTVTDSSFNGLVNIRDLYLIACELNTLRPIWFREMRILEELHIELNGITNLPNGVFENLESLTNLYIGYNNLTQISLAPFGETAFNIEVLSLTQNQVNQIEPLLFDRLENLNSIEMGGNVCSQLNLFNVRDDRIMARARLRRCLENFGPRFINCVYRPIGGEYSCEMSIRNAEGLDFDRVNGTHLSERVDEDVQMVYGTYQNTRNFPPVICRQFPATTTILFYSSYVEVITPESFENCQLLTFLNLDFNIITQVPDNTFSRSPIRELYLGGNLISRVDFWAFNGTRIEFLDLSNNQMYEFNPFVYEPINSTLRTLDLLNNRLGIMYSQTFLNLRNLEYLILSGNQFYNIPADAFDGAVSLEYLGMSNCGLTSLNPRWFESKPDLEILYLGSNRLTELPDGVFDPLTDLKELYIYNNQILELRAAQFGRSLRDIELIYAIANRINSIDAAIVTQGEDLEYFFLQNNLCVNLNFYDVYDDPAEVLRRMQSCNQNFVAAPALSCNYQTIGPDYVCAMTVVNPLENEFEAVGGDHLAGRNDSDVFVVNIINQNTLNYPSVVCSQFSGMRRLQIMTSSTNIISRNAFANCSFLEHILLMRNNIHEIPGGAFSGSPNLGILIAPFNNIRTISSSAFEGTRLQNIDLEFNELSTIDPAWFQPIENHIRVLRLNDNRLSNLDIDSFIRLWNVRELYLNNNPLRTLRYRIFEPMINIEVLQLANCGLTELDPNYFQRNPLIVSLELDRNQLRDLPVGVFNNTRIVHLGLTGNQLRAVDSLSFGTSMNTIRSLHIDLNSIEVIDPNLFENTPNLFALIAYQNECADLSALEVSTNRDTIRELFRPCFNAFEGITATCDYVVFEGMYRCGFNITNPQGRHRFDRITGDHIGNLNDNSVSYVEAIDQFTKTIPSIVCEQFRFVEGITFTGSRVEFIAENTFAHCEYLYSLNLMMNNIRIIPPVAFRQNLYLASLRLDGNQIANIPVELFYGTQIYNLHLSANQITSITRQHFEPIARNLIFLDLRSNRITNLPRGVFAGMTMMYQLELDGNNLGSIPSDTFHSMPYLGFLNIAACGLTTITARHFQEKPFLYQLEIDNNQLTYLPPNLFNMPSLLNLGMNGNQLEFIDSTSFGASLASLLHIGAIGNRIRGIDSLLISRTIDGLDLVGNVCVDNNFIEIQNNRAGVLSALDLCFMNFRRRNDILHCDYAQVYDNYVCAMTLNNADSHIQFSQVDGIHLRGQNNFDVTRIEMLDQLAPRIPPIICQQFPNTRDFIIRNSSLMQISGASFSSCRNLFYLNLNFNDLTFIPGFVFPASLNILSLYNNRIRDFSFDAFAGTNITQLDLNFNRIDQTYVELFWPCNATLEHLYLEYNLMTYLPAEGLANLRNVKFLDLSGNNFADPNALPSNAFVGGRYMDIISLTDMGLSHLDREWFEAMPNLSVLYLYNNRITFLPHGIFAPLQNLNALHLSSNQLTELRVSSFGNSLRSVWYFYVMSNQLSGIQNEIVDELQAAQWLMLTENNCVDRVFLDVPNNREMIRSELSNCISSFQQPLIRCSYYGGEFDSEYFCIMDLHNPDNAAFTTIEGEHASGQSNNDVVSANAFYQNTRTIPSIICTQFPNLQRMMITGSGIEEIVPSSLANCQNLEELYVHMNRIRTIAADTFTNVRSLRVLELGYNEISRIEQGAFLGTSLEMLDLYNNRLTDFTPPAFAGLGATLNYLDLSFNRLSWIPQNAFSNLTNLQHLVLSSNPIEGNIPPSAFSGLTQLRSLGLSRTIIRVLNSAWFTDLSSLEELYLNNNLLREINSNDLGPIMSTIRAVYMQYNFISMFDQIFLMDESTPNLEYLLLAGNICIDEDFLNVQTSRWRIFDSLMTCSNNFYEQPWISCNYAGMPESYVCQISIQNPRGLTFDQIDGQHIEGRNASDVTDIIGVYQNTMVIPAIICQTFDNLRTMRMWSSGIEEIRTASFRECRNLELLDLQLNFIWRIDPNSFLGTRSLRHLELSNNRLSTLPFNAFQNAPLEFLDLAFNQLTEFNHWSFTSVASTLTTLELIGNEITQIRPMSFLNFVNLRRLMISNNPLSDVPRDAFAFLNNLFDLYIANAGLTSLNPEWFESLPSLEQLHINGNRIGELQEGIFSPLLRLRELHMYNNQIRSLTANQFGQLQSLTHILAQDNRIRAFDPEIINRGRNINWLMLSGNICNQDDFSNVQNNRDFVIQRLNTCFFNSGPERLICGYRSYDTDYICSLTIFNPLGREDFIEVEGEHVEGRNDSHVVSLYGSYANTLNFPARICQQFTNLAEVSMLQSGIEYIDETSFAACSRIISISLHANLIQTIPDFVFINNPLLQVFAIERNGLRFIAPNAFIGTSLTHLDVANNPLRDYDPNWASRLGDTLIDLNLMNIDLQGLPVGAFDATPNLVNLVLANNPFVDLPGSIFAPLTRLESLVLGNTNLIGLNLEWFQNLRALRNLNLNGNNLFELPAYIFNPLTNLTHLYIYSNNIRDIDVASFGASINTLDTLSAQYNQIMGIDPSFLNEANNLQILYLSGNNCSEENFYDVQATRANVSTALNQCFSNFAAEFLTCEYYDTAYGDYACRLNISNPIGRDAFTVVPGVHLPGRTNADVTEIDFMNQNTRNIPAIICEQFANIKIFIAWGSNIDLITPRSFAGCTQLEALNLFMNNINNIPANAFVNNPLLNYLELGGNRIENLNPQSFEGSAIEFLDLAANRISVFDATWFAPINATLKFLDLLENRISSLPADAFRSLRDLETLVLSNNPLRGANIPGNAFVALDNLQLLVMGNTQLETLNPNWFTALRSLNYLGLYNTGIETLPNNIFNPLTSLDTLILNNNNIWEINSSQFGSSVETLRVLNLHENVVNMIDASLITSATSLQYLLLRGNICNDQDFTNVVDYLWITLEYLQQCTDNFVQESNIVCEYSNLQADVYMCTLGSHNPRGFDGFASIPGDHLEGQTNEAVSLVYANGANMRNIPSIICRQFPSTWELMFVRSNIEQISEAAFQHCRGLQYVFIMENLIRSIPDNTFANSPNMQYLSVNLNRISSIGPNAFRGTSIDMLDLANNRLEVFDPRSYQTINSTLRSLDLLNNRLRGFPYAAFENVAGIRNLVLNGNPLTNLPFEFLFPLWDLQILSMAHCQLTELHHTWFFNSINLQQLYVQDNFLTEFQDGVFHNMTSLELVYFYDNQIRDLRSISFGMSIPTLRVLRGDSNVINAIDPVLIEDSVNLEYLLLTGNSCVDEAFFNVRDNLAAVQTALQGCFENFQTKAMVEGY